jgi:hypothetical protein
MKTIEVHLIQNESLIIRRYLDADMSIGKFAELMEMTIDEAMRWLHGKGIATSRMFDPILELDRKQNRERLIKW